MSRFFFTGPKLCIFVVIQSNPIQSISPQSNPIQMTWRGGAPGATGAAKIGVKRRDGRRRCDDATTTNGRNKSTSPAQIPLDILYIVCLELETPINSILGVVDMYSLIDVCIVLLFLSPAVIMTVAIVMDIVREWRTK